MKCGKVPSGSQVLSRSTIDRFIRNRLFPWYQTPGEQSVAGRAGFLQVGKEGPPSLLAFGFHHSGWWKVYVRKRDRLTEVGVEVMLRRAGTCIGC